MLLLCVPRCLNGVSPRATPAIGSPVCGTTSLYIRALSIPKIERRLWRAFPLPRNNADIRSSTADLVSDLSR
jgi:hypothetical protein